MSREILEAIEKSNDAFDAFRRRNDERLAELERHFAKSYNRKGNPGGEVTERTSISKAVQSELRDIDFDAPILKAYDRFLRTGQPQPEMKDLSTTDGPSGGFGVPTQIDAMIEAFALKANPIRAWANKSGSRRAIFTASSILVVGVAVGWVRPERAARPRRRTSSMWRSRRANFTQCRVPASGCWMTFSGMRARGLPRNAA